MMPISSSVKKWVTGLGALSGATIFYWHVYGDKEFLKVHNSWTTNVTPSVRWDHNWDRRDPKSLVKPMKIKNESNENIYNTELSTTKAKAVRHILLIRHGQYNIGGKTDSDRTLTKLGRQQAEATGRRLQELGFPYTEIIRSTMTRAQETAKIIEAIIKNVAVNNDSILIEGAPIPPEPPIGHWKSEVHFYEDGPRIEAAFRKYFHRADPSQDKDSYTIIICHANIIRYFVCRALQFPPEGWMRLALKHASITWISVYPSGRVTLLTYGDTGHMKPHLISST
ncbi:serine/threonine-protein phosphatase Pgam5, mitochondrial isoform X1 [Ptiloglossa arizonensis]|uniref:serine/threonine-protein phosphatase Pgam5, mitochondrial isoform X1 n=1 Tax=Ptiloglossa arizonensis TaxID=3350558 RepID=UPI003FA10E12